MGRLIDDVCVACVASTCLVHHFEASTPCNTNVASEPLGYFLYSFSFWKFKSHIALAEILQFAVLCRYYEINE